jgi:hypothetical protein
MNASSSQDLQPLSIEQDVSQLAILLAAILQSCNVSVRLLADRLVNLAESAEVRPGGSAIYAPTTIHLACTELVFVWRRDPAFLDLEGNAKSLSRVGETASFSMLCKRVATHHSPDRLLDYLINMGAVRIGESGMLHLLTESVLACSTQPQCAVAPETVLMHLQGFLGSVEFNLHRRDGDPPPRYERACYGRIPLRLVPVFQQLVATRGQNFIDSIDEWLDRHRSDGGSQSDSCRVGAGAYMLFHASKEIEE